MQYAKTFTDALQFMWGEGFLSPGGAGEVAQMLSDDDLAGKSVLDIGSGLGGVDVLLVETHGAAQVVGIDVEEQLVAAARGLIAEKGLGERIRLELVEPGALPFDDVSFDVVFSKDAMVHIPDKQALYSEVLRVLKPGGRFIAADWLWAAGAEQSPVVNAWLSKGPLSFAFTTPAEAAETMRRAGFRDVKITDQRAALQVSNREEVNALEGPMFGPLSSVVGEQMAMSRLVSARGRQGALDSGDLIPAHLFGTAPQRDQRE
ncbi:class I SAM-dependent methyltransferase [Limibaculum sp. FT325]|uniref:class I SAM-dependent methyltransferase n=1 Tax=Thermohalobaculum sediminis TaxID=2939436 RepID=UPI0020BF831D|nr:class I SAM-dependent methyltransferase [Limibaculum sediminis]MCL5776145.1 class I SAM-dependent methyltransferase [Limibaculum sediminis]